MNKIIGRKRELQILENIWSSKEAEFLAIYGRRRVGKTYLIREYFSQQGFLCEFNGIKDASLHHQLENFMHSLSKIFYGGVSLKVPGSWQEALEHLTNKIEELPKAKKVAIFFDELPWMAGKKSGLLQSLDYFWNSQWSKLPNVKIIACGSAASWMLENLINAKGGLYNRLTKTILLEPFNLSETRVFLESRNIKLNDKQILDIYMIMGGIPHYLKQIEKNMTAAQNINHICFNKDGLLYEEFPKLFKSLFDAADINLAIIKEIAKHRHGIQREQLLKNLKMTSGGTFNKRISELEASCFIQDFVPYGRKRKDHYYRVTDEYTLFYLKWIESFARSKQGKSNTLYWQSKSKTSAWLSWAGYAFEGVAYKHAEEIRIALGIDKVACEIGSWRFITKNNVKDQGAQIDLLFDRDDNAITLCEIKYSDNQFSIDKQYARNLANKQIVFENHFFTKKQIFLVMITTMGIKKNLWSEDLIDGEVILSDLFEK